MVGLKVKVQAQVAEAGLQGKGGKGEKVVGMKVKVKAGDLVIKDIIRVHT